MEDAEIINLFVKREERAICETKKNMACIAIQLQKISSP